MQRLANNELNAFLAYQTLIIRARELNFDELAEYFGKEAGEELNHFKDFQHHMLASGIELSLKPECVDHVNAKNVSELLQIALQLEEKAYQELAAVYGTVGIEHQLFLNGFLRHQHEEISELRRLIEREKLLGVVFLHTLK